MEPEAANTKHNYNMRAKRTAPDPTVELVRAKSDANAPGVGVVADHYHVGGRDERVSGRSYRTNAEPKISGDKRE